MDTDEHGWEKGRAGQDGEFKREIHRAENGNRKAEDTNFTDFHEFTAGNEGNQEGGNIRAEIPDKRVKGGTGAG
jgi:hypothetical protein